MIGQIVHDWTPGTRYCGCMAKLVHVTVLGNSIVMAGIARVLRERTSLLVRLITRIEDLLPVAEAALPTLLIFDIAAITTEQVLSLVHSNPVLALVGIDLEKGQAVTFSGKTCTLYTVEDLTRLINGVDGASTFSLAPSD